MHFQSKILLQQRTVSFQRIRQSLVSFGGPINPLLKVYVRHLERLFSGESAPHRDTCTEAHNHALNGDALAHEAAPSNHVWSAPAGNNLQGGAKIFQVGQWL